jgi:hypothetical protein
MPFRYGIATMTQVPHLVMRLTVEIDGRAHVGFAADNLPPKWFTKNPETSYRADLADMIAVIRHACDAALSLPAAPTVFALWRELYDAQKTWAAHCGHPPLLGGFGVSLVERAVIDAFCRASGKSFADAVRTNSLGIDPSAIHPELARNTPADFLPPQPLDFTIVRHTVGLADPLRESEIEEAERVMDGLPQSLEACIRAHGLTHFKIKLCGEIGRDCARLREIAGVLAQHAPHAAFTLDGNENYNAVTPFRALWDEFLADPAIARLLAGLIFVEQPFHRDVALTGETAAGLRAWRSRPPIIIDESDSDLHALPLALASGYAGTSHKNCKGVIKGIVNACLLAHRRQIAPDAALHLSAEDLTNIGPIALLQDLAVIATLGITHAERNGHHYFAGMRQFSGSIRHELLRAHGDVYESHPDGFPIVAIREGRIRTRSVTAAPFGVDFEPDVAEFTPLAEWRADSL